MAYLNATSIIRRIESRLGLSHHILELSQDDIMEVIKQETLPTFSKHYPYMVNHTISKNDEVYGRVGVYYLKTDLNIIGVTEVITDSTSISGSYSSNYFNNPIAGKMGADISSAYTHPLIFHFQPPNIIEIKPKDYAMNDIIAVLRVVHPEHLMTIPLALREQFLELALLDICMVLYPIRHNFSQINTSFGTVEINMELIESANDRRTELLDTFSRDAIKRGNRRNIIIM